MAFGFESSPKMSIDTVFDYKHYIARNPGTLNGYLSQLFNQVATQSDHF